MPAAQEHAHRKKAEQVINYSGNHEAQVNSEAQATQQWRLLLRLTVGAPAEDVGAHVAVKRLGAHMRFSRHKHLDGLLAAAKGEHTVQAPNSRR
jgi:hypothetical protein